MISASVTGLPFSQRARETALFVGVIALIGDLVTTGLDFVSGRLFEGRGPLLDVWDVSKAGGIAVGMLVVAVRARSKGSAVFAFVFAMIAVQDQYAWHGQAAEFLSNTLELGALQNLISASQTAWGEFIVLTLLAAVGGILAWSVSDRWMGFRSARKVLTILLIILFIFATVVDLLSAAAADGTILALVEETGERLTLSVVAGYVAGMVVTVVRTPNSHPPWST